MEQNIGTQRKWDFRGWILGLAIIIVLNLFFSYGIRVFIPDVSYENYCKPKQVTIQPDTQDECVLAGGAWTENAYPDKRTVPVVPGEIVQTGYCDLNFTCAKEYQDAFDIYQRNVFMARVVLGTLALIVGFSLVQYGAVSAGLSLGGVLSLFIATVGYWSKLGNYLQVIVLALVLGLLIWVGIKKIR